MPCAADEEFAHFYHVEIDPETRVQIHVQVCTVLLVNPYRLLLKNWNPTTLMEELNCVNTKEN